MTTKDEEEAAWREADERERLEAANDIRRNTQEQGYGRRRSASYTGESPRAMLMEQKANPEAIVSPSEDTEVVAAEVVSAAVDDALHEVAAAEAEVEAKSFVHDVIEGHSPYPSYTR